MALLFAKDGARVHRSWWVAQSWVAKIKRKGGATTSCFSPPPVIDTLLAATALEVDLCLVTRNIRDVADSGATLFNPWNDS